MPNDMTHNALTLPNAADLATVFKTENGIEPVIARIELAARSEANGLTADTAKGRDALKSLAHKVSQSKAEIDRQGKALTEEQRREIEAVNKGRRIADDRLAALRDEIRKPVTDWEEAEAARKARIDAAIDSMRNHGMGAENTSAEMAAKAVEVKALVFGEEFGDRAAEAEHSREATLSALRLLYAAAKTREDQAAELEALRAEKAERERLEAEREATAKAEAERLAAEERAKAEAEAAEKRRQEEAARIEREKIEAAERARVEAERIAQQQAERAQREAAEREAALQRQLAAETARAEAAAQAERDRIAAEQKAEADARAKREADAAHRQRICDEITQALITMSGASPKQIAVALMAGQIPHCEVQL